jgi:hypothetical protein
MSFYFKTPDFDLGTIEIENIFINDFMPGADGLSVKVYLLALKMASDHEGQPDLDNEGLARILKVPLTDVVGAWKYWETKSVVRIHPRNPPSDYDFDVEFISLRQLFIDKNYYNPHHSHEQILRSKTDKIYQRLFDAVTGILGSELQANERRQLVEFLETYPFNDEMVLAAFENIKRGAYSSRISTVKKRLFNWKDLGISTAEELKDYISYNEDRQRFYRDLLEALGLNRRKPTLGEKEVIDKWLDTYQLEPEVIMEKIREITLKNPSVNMNYLDVVMTALHHGESAHKPPVRKNPKANRFHNYTDNHEKLSEEELEKQLVKNMKSR